MENIDTKKTEVKTPEVKKPVVEEKSSTIKTSEMIDANKLNELAALSLLEEEAVEEQVDFREVSIKMNAISAHFNNDGFPTLTAIFKIDGQTVKKSVKMNKVGLTEEVIMNEILYREIEIIEPKRFVIKQDNGEVRETYSATDYKVLDKTKKTKKDSFFDANLYIDLEEAELEIESITKYDAKKKKEVTTEIFRIVAEIQEGMTIISLKYRLDLPTKTLSLYKESLKGHTFDIRINYIQKLTGKENFTTALPDFK